ncbi:MAG TPA: RNA polymerase sigma factor [Myxococcales bacterium]|nr:RNA polymerase sigma factor [Myxococcales bacterium]
MENASVLEHELAELHPLSFGWALSCCRYDRVEAEEVLQTSYLKILSGRARFERRSSFKTWLFGVIRRTAAEARRRHLLARIFLARMERLRPERAEVPGPSGDPSVVSLLRGLARRQREVLELVFYQDLSLREAAAVMGVSLGSARVHYHRGKENLREALAGRPRRGAG